MRAFLGLGSNLGDRWTFLRNAVASIPDLKRKSSVYESAAITGGGPPQPPYLNAVVELDTKYEPRMLLKLAMGLEMRAGRKRDKPWAARTLDVDVLWCEGWKVDEADLKVPHPRMWERAFVVAPLSDLAADIVPPDKRQWALRHVTRQQATL